MTPRTDDMNQAATYWAPGANDGFGGVAYGAATAIKCRWQDKADLFRSPEGQELVANSVVYVDRALAIGGRLALGTFVGAPPAGAGEVRQAGSSPALDADETLLKVWLAPRRSTGAT